MAPLEMSSNSLAELYLRCVKMANENKISAKNAFDLPLIEHIDDIVESFMGGIKRKAGDADGAAPGAASSSSVAGGSSSAASQAPSEAGQRHSFHEVSCTIEASARIYACRVDCVHTNVFRILGGLGCTPADEDGEEGEEREGDALPKRRRICGVNTLERNEANITQPQGEAGGQSDPTFLNMAAAFDAGGARGLLLAQLPIAEDLSLVFNGDVPLDRAAQVAEPLFEQTATEAVLPDKLGFGEPVAARAKLAASRLCPPELDGLRSQLWGGLSGSAALPPVLEALLDPCSHSCPSTPVAAARASSDTPATSGRPEVLSPLPLVDDALGCDLSVVQFDEAANEQPDLPVVAAEDPLAFDELLERFGGGAHQFAYLDECWGSKPRLQSWAWGAKEGEQFAGALTDVEGTLVPLQDRQGSFGGAEGALVQLPERQGRGRQGQEVEKVERKTSKRTIFDLASLDLPIEPLEMEPVQKHTLSDSAAERQLQQDVPPYMIDRITMPTWLPSMVDFACLGLRPHLMLRLLRKEPPEDRGPHGFFDLFSTEVAESPEAPLWLGSAGAPAGLCEWSYGAGDSEGFDASQQLDVDPQDDPLMMPGPDLDMAAHEPLEVVSHEPLAVETLDALCSPSAKFIDVRLVKRHLWDCISEDDARARAALPRPERAASSFQGLVDRTAERMPEATAENLSVAVCFICALQLCNERGLELEVDESRPLGDFSVVGPT